MKLIKIDLLSRKREYANEDVLIKAAMDYINRPIQYAWAKSKTLEETDKLEGYCKHNYYVLETILDTLNCSKKVYERDYDLACLVAKVYMEFERDIDYEDILDYLEDQGYLYG
jgi:competence CoiA-like predicted nuclease